MAASPTLESLLLDEGLVSDTALRQARRVALRRHAPLLEVLIDEHSVEEEPLAEALSRRLELPRIHLAQAPAVGLDEEALREVPHDLAAAHLVMPTRLEHGGDRRTLQLAMVNPLDTAAVEDIAHATGCQLELVVATLSEVRAAIQRSYRGLITKMIPRLPDAERDAAHAGAVGEPTTAPHLHLPDERSTEARLRALVELLVEKGVLGPTDLDERVRRLLRGEDV